jgi:hypothetical protein
MTSAVFQRGIGMSSEDTLVPAHRLWTPEGFREDEWRHAESAEALEGNGNVILPLPVFLELDPALRENAFSRIGVKLAPGEPLDAIVPYLESRASALPLRISRRHPCGGRRSDRPGFAHAALRFHQP